MATENLISPMVFQHLQMLMNTMLAQSTKTGETTAAIHLTVTELRQLLALLSRPEAQELELGQSLEQALIRILERLERIEFSQAHLVTSQKALDDRLARLESGQATILAILEPFSGLDRAMHRMEAGQEQMMGTISDYFADPFPPADSPSQ